MEKVFIPQRADPCVLRWDGWYYFTASVPAFDCIELRRARTLAELPEAPARVVWRRHETGPLSMNIWAPEIHRVDGQWVIYFAAAQADADEEGCYDHRIYALTCGDENPVEGAWQEAGQIRTGWESFALDATTAVIGGVRYFIWAQRDFRIPGNSNLYIAEMADFRTLKLPAVRLSVPEYDWECRGFLVNEGPSVLQHGGRVFITYSASATDERYAMGLLTLKAGGHPLRREDWEKSPVPVMVSEPENGLFGPGHNSFTVDEAGNDLLVFHARPYPGFRGTALSDPNRHAFLRRVRWRADGTPVFQGEI
ncbi:MAG: family 43 glycosylhydrolase [Clostridia bacterium]|nr:family 43 glycosylhydrolase [Clostridia bacterium]